MSLEAEWLSEPGRHLIALEDELYPALLKKIPSPPAQLWVAGDPALLWQPQLAVVGSRNPTAGGLDHARSFASELSRTGLAITSGLASGVDAAAHQAALDAGGATIAVTGTGLDRVYPRSSTELAAAIEQRGVLVSEYPPGTDARRGHFPSRNRIISGLSLGVLVVEAGINSGSLITARLAGEQGREVFALPGSLHNPMAKGCHRLIKQGARLVESTQDILEELTAVAGELASALRDRLEPTQSPGHTPAVESESLLDDPEYARLWEAIGYDPLPVEHLIGKCGLTAQELSSMLLRLELGGLVETQAGGKVNRSSKMA